MEQENVDCLLEQAISGNAYAREKVIEHYRSFIKREAQRICHRYLEWGNDDELSIALMAFNESIDAYRQSKGDSLEKFARVVIRRRLIDYFRQSDSQSVLCGEEIISQITVEEDWERCEREEEIRKYGELLSRFNISFQYLARVQPKHRKTRERLRQVAKTLADCEELMMKLYRSGMLPKNELCKRTGVTSRMLDRGRAYVIALALLLSRDDLPFLQDYVSELMRKGDK